MRARSQWYGIDFMRADGDRGRSLFRTDGKTIEDFYSWGEAVMAPSHGTVEIALDGLPDHPIGTDDKQNVCGNHIVIRTRSDHFVFIAHLQKDSVGVKKGDTVVAGQLIGRCGNSGHNSAPHIHMHTQDAPGFGKGTGQNMVFEGMNVEMTGQIFENVTWPLIRGLFVWNGNK